MSAIERVRPDELADQFVLCRTLGHAWDELPNAEFSAALWRTSAGALALRCARCYTERFDYIGKDMAVASRRYVYPKGYQGVEGEGRGRPNLRGELFRRSLLVHRYANRDKPLPPLAIVDDRRPSRRSAAATRSRSSSRV
jgi:hypothetical protein